MTSDSHSLNHRGRKSVTLLRALGANEHPEVDYIGGRKLIFQVAEKHFPNALSGHKTWVQYSTPSKNAFFAELFKTPGLEMLSQNSIHDITEYMSKYLGKLHYKRERKLTATKALDNSTTSQTPEVDELNSENSSAIPDSARCTPPETSPDIIKEFLTVCDMEHLTSELLKTGCINMKRIRTMASWDHPRIKQFLSKHMSATPMEIEIVGDNFVALGQKMKELQAEKDATHQIPKSYFLHNIIYVLIQIQILTSTERQLTHPHYQRYSQPQRSTMKHGSPIYQTTQITLSWILSFTSFIDHGANIGFTGDTSVAQTSSNLKSAYEYPDTVTDAIQTQLSKGHIHGPFSVPPFPNYRSSPLGVAIRK
ncbi:hypothetical protein C8J56DRAFT_1166650 [Mycena floridula]|nr:hypothetical protein C8J56DRAFT_1166650 [Mycena floridula]